MCVPGTDTLILLLFCHILSVPGTDRKESLHFCGCNGQYGGDFAAILAVFFLFIADLGHFVKKTDTFLLLAVKKCNKNIVS